MELKRILVAINSPDTRDSAFQRGLSLGKAFGAELYVLHAVPVNSRFSFRAAERLERMADLRKRAEDAGVRVQTVEQQGDPAEIIELHASARHVDLIIIGSEPSRGWRRRDRSLVAEGVIRRTAVPTLVVASDAPGAPNAFRTVFVAVDLSPASADVLDAAIQLTAGEPGQLTVMHTVTGVEAADAVRSPARWMVPEYRAHLMEDARRGLEKAVQAVPAGVETLLQVSSGSAARAICDGAADAGADLVVVGRSRGMKMLGSTALRVLRQNDRALLVVPSVSRRAAQRQRAA